jgi:hypothetical protein
MSLLRLRPSRAARGTSLTFATTIVFASACASPQRPAVLTQVDATRQTNATLQAAEFAPQSYAQAEQHRAAAERQWKDGKIASSQIAAERALAGYEQTHAAARIARTERQLAKTQQQVDESQRTLGEIQAKLKLVATEQADLETQVKIEQDAEALTAPKPASAEREAARRETTRALCSQARLLCASARLLGSSTESLDPKFSSLDTLDDQLKQAHVPTPIDVAIRLRAECLHELTLVRRAMLMAQPQGTTGDELFVKLSSARFSPSRDDRGVSVTFFNAFAANALAPSALSALKQLSPIIKSYPDVPLLVVVHATNSNQPNDEARGRAAIEALKQMGAANTDVRLVGDRLPLLDPHKAAGPEPRNQRLEVVFVVRSN